ncbi:MAG: hypothetical protein KGJ86_16945, partial [Chloroflexota bacterium]|nr:hypothetical protein [Chloroflexota bacterium]
ADERARATVMASNLAKWTLRADGAVFTKAIGGAPNVDMALIADRCEQLGIKTSLILFELAATGDSADSALFNSRSLDAIVSIGASGLPVDLGPVDRVITNRPEAVEALRGPLKINASVCVGAMDHLGGGRFTGIRY